MIAILGSGFGLYGYLPALVGGCGQRIVLPERYRARFSERPELARFADDVQWERDEEAALDHVGGVVLALPPVEQTEWIPQCLARANIERLLLEKPLGSSPELAAALLGDLTRARKVVRIGYTFRYTTWGRRLRDPFKTGEKRPLSIQWNFLSHHLRHGLHNWKRFSVSGGGAIRFYGIQLIALLAEIGYRDVISSQSFGKSADEVEKWTATFSGPGLPACDVAVDTAATVAKFRVELLSNSSTEVGAVFANLIDPFEPAAETGQWGDLDRRVPILNCLCRSLWEESFNPYSWYEATIELWRRIEERTRFEVG